MTVAPETNAKVMSALWGVLLGACVAMTIGFAWGGWTSSRTTQKISEEALLTSRAAICVAQVTNDPNHAAVIAEFYKTYSSRRPNLIEKGGWDRMPGQKEAAWGVSSACVRGLEARTGTRAPPGGGTVSE